MMMEQVLIKHIKARLSMSPKVLDKLQELREGMLAAQNFKEEFEGEPLSVLKEYIVGYSSVYTNISHLDGWTEQQLCSEFHRKTGSYPGFHIIKKGVQYHEEEPMTWQDYEIEVRDEFIEHGMLAKITGGSSDGGIDVIVEHNGLVIGIQVKDWQNRVGIKVVGEVLMGMGSHGCDYGCVVARNGYTQPCHTSAIENKIALLDMEDISVYVEKIKRGRL